jgi:aryl-alcohol dehydrogenase-like predicted oxidoreductase
MQHRRLGKTGLMVSELCLGCMTFGRELDERGSREIVGRAIKGVREDVVLATKVRFPMGDGPNDVGLSRKHILAGCEASLRRLGTDYINLYQVHPDNYGATKLRFSAQLGGEVEVALV